MKLIHSFIILICLITMSHAQTLSAICTQGEPVRGNYENVQSVFQNKFAKPAGRFDVTLQPTLHALVNHELGHTIDFAFDSPCGQTKIQGSILKSSSCSSQGFDLFAAKKFNPANSLTGYLAYPEFSSPLKIRI